MTYSTHRIKKIGEQSMLRKTGICALALIVLSSCIANANLKEGPPDDNKIVITGVITRKEGGEQVSWMRYRVLMAVNCVGSAAFDPEGKSAAGVGIDSGTGLYAIEVPVDYAATASNGRLVLACTFAWGQNTTLASTVLYDLGFIKKPGVYVVPALDAHFASWDSIVPSSIVLQSGQPHETSLKVFQEKYKDYNGYGNIIPVDPKMIVHVKK
ncbi:hypothetical protein [Leptonema illini]|nr:hypothetical protein [Leptonema illini]